MFKKIKVKNFMIAIKKNYYLQKKNDNFLFHYNTGLNYYIYFSYMIRSLDKYTFNKINYIKYRVYVKHKNILNYFKKKKKDKIYSLLQKKYFKKKYLIRKYITKKYVKVNISKKKHLNKKNLFYLKINFIFDIKTKIFFLFDSFYSFNRIQKKKNLKKKKKFFWNEDRFFNFLKCDAYILYLATINSTSCTRLINLPRVDYFFNNKKKLNIYKLPITSNYIYNTTLLNFKNNKYNVKKIKIIKKILIDELNFKKNIYYSKIKNSIFFKKAYNFRLKKIYSYLKKRSNIYIKKQNIAFSHKLWKMQIFSYLKFANLKYFYILNKDFKNFGKFNNTNNIYSFFSNQNINLSISDFYKNKLILLTNNLKIMQYPLNLEFLKKRIRKKYRLSYHIYLTYKKQIKVIKKKINININTQRFYIKSNFLTFKNKYFYLFLNNKLKKNKIFFNNNKINVKFIYLKKNFNKYIIKKNIFNKYLLKKNFLNLKYIWGWHYILNIFFKKYLKYNILNLFNNIKLRALFLKDITTNINKLTFLKFNILFNKYFKNNKYFYNQNTSILLKLIIKKYLLLYKKINKNKLFFTKIIKRKYNKKYIYKINGIINILKRFNYFNKLKYNVHNFNKIFKKINVNFHIAKDSSLNYKQFGVLVINILLNNTYITLTDLQGKVICTLCSGLLKIKGPKRSTNVASEEIAIKMVSIILKKKIKFILLKLNGVLHSRKMKSAIKGLFSKKYTIIKCINITPKAHNGIRRRKIKRF